MVSSITLLHECRKHFKDYSELCFKEFGDRVKHWITLNEPLALSVAGYATGDLAPGRCSEWLKRNCTGGDSGVEPYLVTHNQLLAHATAVKLYKEKYQVIYNNNDPINSIFYVYIKENVCSYNEIKH